MPRTRILFALFALLLSSLACATLLDEPVDEIENPIEIPLTEAPVEEPTADAAAACPAIIDQIIAKNSTMFADDGTGEMNFGDRGGEEATYLVTYLVSGDEIGNPFHENVPSDLQDEQDDTASHQQLWGYFAALIPREYRTHLAEFAIMTDGMDNTLAAVGQTYDDPNLWSLEVDIADTYDYHYLTFTLVHEFAHLLTLGPDQVPPSEAVFNNPEDNDIYLRELSACPNYFPGEGCANADSYINEFHDRFWLGIYDEWNEINLEENDDAYYERLDDFYYEYQDQFVTDYAVTHIAEDIAESFSFFVFSPAPDGDTIAEQKILFFYEYPELVELRRQILASLCAVFPE